MVRRVHYGWTRVRVWFVTVHFQCNFSSLKYECSTQTDDDHSNCDDSKWERTRPDPVPHWELPDLTEDERATFEELDPNFSSNGLNYVYLYGDSGIEEAAGRAKCCDVEEDNHDAALPEVKDNATKLSIAPPPVELVQPQEEGELPVIMLLRPYAAGWSAFAFLNKRGGRELIRTREPICVPTGGFVEVGVVLTALPNVQHSLRRVIFVRDISSFL